MGKKYGKFTLKDWLIYGSIGGVLGLGIAWGLTDGLDLYYKHKTGLELIDRNAHLKAGVHDVIITDQFYRLLEYEDVKSDNKNYEAIKDTEFSIINGIKKAYEDLNAVNKGIQFNLCAETDKLTEYDIPQKDNVDKKNDLLLYMSPNKMKSSSPNKATMAITDFDHNDFTGELTNETIIFQRDYMAQRWGTSEELADINKFNPINTYAYVLTVHESMHAMGFAHQKGADSIMYPYVTKNSPKTLTKKDIAMIKRYNEVFYNSKYETPDFDSVATEKEMIF